MLTMKRKNDSIINIKLKQLLYMDEFPIPYRNEKLAHTDENIETKTNSIKTIKYSRLSLLLITFAIFVFLSFLIIISPLS